VPQCHSQGQGPVGQGQGLILKAKAKAKDLTIKAKAKAKDSKFVLEDTSRPRTKAKDNNTVVIHIVIFALKTKKYFLGICTGHNECITGKLVFNVEHGPLCCYHA